MNKTTKLLATASLVASVFLTTSSFAAVGTSKVDIKNQTGDKLTIIVEPGLGSVPEHKHAMKKIIENGASTTIEVTKDAHFTDSFSITGKREEHPIKDAGSVIKHTCQHLKLNENYQVDFTKNSVGQIECNHTEAK